MCMMYRCRAKPLRNERYGGLYTKVAAHHISGFPAEYKSAPRANTQAGSLYRVSCGKARIPDTLIKMDIKN